MTEIRGWKYIFTNMDIATYINKLNTRYKTGITTEHSFRGDLQNLLETMLPDVVTTNEPTRIQCGAPDYILTKKEIPVGYIEAKDLGADLNSKSHQAQFKRYKDALSNLIITNYLDFQVYKDGLLVTEYSIGAISGNGISGKTEQYDAFTAQLKDFATTVGQTIKSASKLAVMMAVKARMLAEVIGTALVSDVENEENSTLKDQLKAFKDILIHDIGAKEFADIYAQTIAYGMFAARLHDTTLPTFSRQEAAELIPKTNPFLRKLFQYVAGYDLDKRIVWIVDALADIFRATDVKAILNNFGKATQQNDPIIHFYETFLSEYDPKLRKARGVWYTPEPVVNFIVRAVDDILKTEFNLPDGLADTSKTKIKVKVPTHDKRYSAGVRDYEQEVHKVQILDPATGTGTFLAEVIKYIYNSKFEGQQGIWSNYVENHLIPRINGFELLMASYAMAHLKLELLLTETGYKPTKDQRLRVYLTNSLEESHPDSGTLFANWLSTEANEANQIKRDTPVMVVIGNPPYNVKSKNKGKWILQLIDEYKKGLNERKINLDDDYIKFLRYSHHYVEKTGYGVVAMITNNSYLNGITHRQMRKSLLSSFNKIYIFNLHGDVKGKEDSSEFKDENVFDIPQGVCISLLIKTSNKNSNDSINYISLQGRRNDKYKSLSENSISDINWQRLECSHPYYFFTPKDFQQTEEHEKGFLINELFIEYNSGIQTKNDRLTVHFTQKGIEEVVINFKTKDKNELIKLYGEKDGSWNIEKAIDDIKSNQYTISPMLYRPFDIRYTALTKKSGGFLGRPRYDTMKHMVNGNNLALIVNKQFVGNGYSHVGVTDKVNCHGTFYLGNKAQDYILPLYTYIDKTIQFSTERTPERQPNFDEKIIKEIAGAIKLKFTIEKENGASTFAPIDVLDYIYAVLHSPAYREQYKEFLKIDFPRVPYPKDAATFWALVKLGGEIRQLHLLEAPAVGKYITKYPIDGNNEVTKPVYKDGRVWINDTQYFEGVPPIAWEFYIGGYQPAQKWLKDRKGRILNFEEILHYQKMIVALTETDRIMKEIDKVDFM
jgi:predicted helicase